MRPVLLAGALFVGLTTTACGAGQTAATRAIPDTRTLEAADDTLKLKGDPGLHSKARAESAARTVCLNLERPIQWKRPSGAAAPASVGEAWPIVGVQAVPDTRHAGWYKRIAIVTATGTTDLDIIGAQPTWGSYHETLSDGTVLSAFVSLGDPPGSLDLELTDPSGRIHWDNVDLRPAEAATVTAAALPHCRLQLPEAPPPDMASAQSSAPSVTLVPAGPPQLRSTPPQDSRQAQLEDVAALSGLRVQVYGNRNVVLVLNGREHLEHAAAGRLTFGLTLANGDFAHGVIDLRGLQQGRPAVATFDLNRSGSTVRLSGGRFDLQPLAVTS
jgi:hypothetical protein